MTPTEAMLEAMQEVIYIDMPTREAAVVLDALPPGWRLCGPDDVRKVDAWDALMEDVKATAQRTGMAVSHIDHAIARLVGPDDVTVTVDGLARALECLPWLERQVWRGEYDDAAAAILAALSADKEGQ